MTAVSLSSHIRRLLLLAAVIASLGASKCESAKSDDEGGAGSGGNVTPSDSDPESDEIDNTPAGCTDIDASGTSFSVDETIGPQDTDYFCFELDTAGGLRIDPSGKSVSIQLSTDEDSGALVLGAIDARTLTLDLLPGRYLVRTTDYLLGSGGYTLTFSRTPYDFAPPESDPGSTTPTAHMLSLGTALTSVDGYVGPIDMDEADLYRVSVPPGSTLAVQIEHIGMAGTVEVAIAEDSAIVDFNNTLATLKTGPGLATLTSDLQPPEGSYVIQVSGSGIYRLGVALANEQ